MKFSCQVPIEEKILLYKNKLNFNETDTIGLVPAGEYSKKVAAHIKNKNLFFLDENEQLIDEKKIFNLKDIKKLKQFDYIIITSYTYHKILEKKLLSSGVKKEKIFNFGENVFLNEIDIQNFFPIYTKNYLTKKGFNIYEKFIYDIQNSKKIILFIGPYFYDIYEKIRILKKNSNNFVVWCRLDASYLYNYNETYDFYELNNLIDIIVLFKKYNLEFKISVITIHPISYYNLVYSIRYFLPRVKIIPYIYDWLNLFCPYEHKGLYKKYRNLTDDEVNEEYKSLDKIIEGKNIDGIIYKDGNEYFSLLKNFPKPKLFFPAVKSKKIFMSISKKQRNNLNKIIFIGSLISKNIVLPTLFKDAILFNTFEQVLKQGFTIDVYYAKNTESVTNEYKKFFKNYKNFSVKKGDLLENLFPKIVGKYGWGWMIYDDDYAIIKEHINYTLPSKIFAYLALGAPIIVMDDFKQSAELIRKYNIGIVINRNEIGNVSEIIKRVNYEKMLENIIKAREIFVLENYEKKFINFLQKIDN